MFGQNRQEIRQVYFDVWKKFHTSAPLTELEKHIAHIIELHPEYHTLFNQPDKIDQDYFVEAGETNPYLHMGLHLALHEQIQTNRPQGIRDIYQQLLHAKQDPHHCDHMMMDCLAQSIWQAQRDGMPPSEDEYLNALKQLLP